MEEKKKAIPKINKQKIYSKNYFIKDIGTIGGKDVTPAIDKALDAALSNVGKKAIDFHVDKK